MADIHTLIVTANVEDPDNSDLFEYSINCPGVTDACRMWVECDIPTCRRDNSGANEAVQHGKRHCLLVESGTWSVPTDTCYLVLADEMPDAAVFLVGQQHLEAGEYRIGHDFDAGCIADFQLITQES